MKGIRWKDGVDVWTCSCGAVVMMGRGCRCGKTYADILFERKGEKAKKSRTSAKMFRDPASRTEFTKSYLFRKGKH